MNVKIKSAVILFLCTGIISTAVSKTIICCIGNSITAAGYPTNLLKLLGSTDYMVYNEGVGGTTLLKNGDHPYWVEGKFAHVFSVQPNIVTIKLGTNDTKSQNWDSHNGEFKRDYLAVIDTLNTLTSKPKIWIVLPIPVVKESFGIRDSIVKKIIPILKEIGQERNLPIIDANTPLLNAPQCYQTDGVHPTAAGSDTIAHIIYRALISTGSLNIATFPRIQSKTPEVVITNGMLSLSILDGATSIRLFDLRGRTILSQSFQTPGRHAFFSKNLPCGIYLLRMQCSGLEISYRTIAIP
jgi:acyl-CoA thioesterase I